MLMSARSDEAEWNARKGRMEELWLKQHKTKEEVIETMKDEGFDAPKSKYRKYFKKWGWKKNEKSEDWKSINLTLAIRQNKPSNVFKWGKLLPNEEVDKAIHRQSNRPNRLEIAQAFVMPPNLPREFRVSTPVFDRTASLVEGLPFFQVEASLWAKQVRAANRPMYINPTLLQSENDVQQGLPASPTSGSRAEQLLVSGTLLHSDISASSGLLPHSSSEGFKTWSLAVNQLDLKSLTSTHSLLRQVLYSFANNFAGISDDKLRNAMYFLLDQTSFQLFDAIRDAPSFTARAIAQTLFKGAIEIGNAPLVSHLLDDPTFGIDANKQICLVGGYQYTPIERACLLRYNDVIKVLLGRTTDLNKTYPRPGRDNHDLLDCVFNRRRPGTYIRLDDEIVQMLLDAGADAGIFTILDMISIGEHHFAYQIINKLIAKHDARGLDGKVLYEAFKYFQEPICIDLVRNLLEIGADFTARINDEPYDGFNLNNGFNPSTMIDIVAQRGFRQAVEFLLSQGVALTNDSLSCAVTSGNLELVSMLLCKGANVGLVSEVTKATPLSAAIRLQDRLMIHLLKEKGALDHISDIDYMTSILDAASDAGDPQWFQEVMQASFEHTPRIDGTRLATATRDGYWEAVKPLIQSGADLDVVVSQRCTLSHALSQRSRESVYLLLHAGADPKFSEDHIPGRELGSAIEIAAEWGDHDIVEALLEAGLRIRREPTHRALCIAVTRRDRRLVEKLLRAGAPSDWRHKRYSTMQDRPSSPLEAAARNFDLTMVHYLLQHGANADDSPALTAAVKLGNDDIIRKLLSSFRARYPEMCPSGYGSAALAVAVDHGNEYLIELLLDYGVETNRFEGYIYSAGEQLTPFGLALTQAGYKRTVIVNTFLEAQCDPNSTVCEMVIHAQYSKSRALRTSAFQVAIRSCDLDLIELLVKHKANVNMSATGRFHRTPLQTAVETGNLEVVQYLLNLGADVNAPANIRGGATALQLSAIAGTLGIACLLLNYGAEVDAPAAKVDGYTALEGAAANGRLDMVHLLLKQGACSGGRDKKQLEKATKLALEKGHFPVADMLKSIVNQGDGRLELDPSLGDAEDHMSLDYQDFVTFSP